MFSPVFYLSAENIAYNRLADSTYTETVLRVNAVDIISDSWRRISFFSSFSFFPEFICSPVYLALLFPTAVYLLEIALRIEPY